MEWVLVLLCLLSLVARAAAVVVLPLRLQEVLPPPQVPAKNMVRFRRNVSLTVPVSVGTPPQNVTMVLDTGSELSWLLCNATTTSSSSPFNASASWTYRGVPCASPDCQWRGRDLPVWPTCAPDSTSCRVSLSYADATSADGLLAADTFALAAGAGAPALLFGCITSYYSSSDSDDATTGLLGMNRGALSLVTQTGTRRFAYCIAPGDAPGLLVLGDGDAAPSRPLSYTPLVEVSLPLPYFDRAAYSVQLDGIRVGATRLPIPEWALAPDHTGAGQTMLDSGTQFTFLLADAYAALKREFANQTRALLAPLDDDEHQNFAFQGAFDACFRATEARMAVVLARGLLPEVGLVLRGGAEVVVGGDRLLHAVPGERRRRGKEEEEEEAVWCLTFGSAEAAGVEAYVIGHHHQQDVWVEYDLRNGRVGFAPARCSIVAAQRLGATTGA
ncbi:hypothetical protein PR202_gb19385 [Eleusine coracana subsp. coracana]|uniref:Peptidase A1 domain-containing protein n=1 Tax=Eleusine coracana subsp. coracana TaxID=191504 RepID=A0AAV5F845_ELECO|nr:hypothetical protein QOZ80_3BG0285450 [Eleusine coracana subsp. coracana]GJN31031.1 hypothetical protein PR202_gb19385 [Eleusine coracana subsp. coracana]